MGLVGISKKTAFRIVSLAKRGPYFIAKEPMTALEVVIADHSTGSRKKEPIAQNASAKRLVSAENGTKKLQKIRLLRHMRSFAGRQLR